MKHSFIKAVKNHNKLYTLFIVWTVWLGIIFGYFAGTYLAELLFFLGFMGIICWAAYITDSPNEKEQKTMDRWNKMFDN